MDSTKPDSENNFLVALDRSGNEYGLAYMDLVTGSFRWRPSMTLLWFVEKSNLRAREVVLGYELPEQEERVFVSQMNLLVVTWGTALDDVQLLGDQLSELEKKKTAGKLLQYVHQTQMRELSHLKKKPIIMICDFLQMDFFATKASLDLTENARTGKKHGSLYWYLDETKTAMGGRLLRSWIQNP